MEQTSILRYTVEVLERIGVPYLIVGSMASIAYGEARLTLDIDVLVELEGRHVGDFVAAFPADEFYCNVNSVQDAVRDNSQFNILHPSSGHKIDFILPRKDPWGQSHLERGRLIRLLPDREVMTASPEDVVLGKLWYHALGGGDRHLRDIAGILRVSGSDVNREVIEYWAGRLGHLDLWRQVVAKIDGTDKTE
jgi:hypothetical protein